MHRQATRRGAAQGGVGVPLALPLLLLLMLASRGCAVRLPLAKAQAGAEAQAQEKLQPQAGAGADAAGAAQAPPAVQQAEKDALLAFMSALNYHAAFTTPSAAGSPWGLSTPGVYAPYYLPCAKAWAWITCTPQGRVSAISMGSLALFQANSSWGGPPGAEPLTGYIPWDALGALQSLTSLVLSGNAVSGTLEGVGALSALQVLRLSNNNINGTIPGATPSPSPPSSPSTPASAPLPLFPPPQPAPPPPSPPGTPAPPPRLPLGLREMLLDSNALSGSLPASLASLPSLERLSVGVNGVVGPFPPGLGRLSRLQFLDLHGNALRGPLPADWGALGALTQLNLASTTVLMGSDGSLVPESWSAMSSLLQLSLESSALSGPYPEVLTRLPAIAYLSLASNSLHGPLPARLWAPPRLMGVDVSANFFLGAPPLPGAERASSPEFSFNAAGNCLTGGPNTTANATGAGAGTGTGAGTATPGAGTVPWALAAQRPASECSAFYGSFLAPPPLPGAPAPSAPSQPSSATPSFALGVGVAGGVVGLLALALLGLFCWLGPARGRRRRRAVGDEEGGREKPWGAQAEAHAQAGELPGGGGAALGASGVPGVGQGLGGACLGRGAGGAGHAVGPAGAGAVGCYLPGRGASDPSTVSIDYSMEYSEDTGSRETAGDQRRDAAAAHAGARLPGSSAEGVVIEHQGAREYRLSELERATAGFRRANLIGRGTFGEVYYGELPAEGGGVLRVAVKRRLRHALGTPVSTLGSALPQGPEAGAQHPWGGEEEEGGGGTQAGGAAGAENGGGGRGLGAPQEEASFRNEIRILSAAYHRNLVGLRGYCWEAQQLLLVYDFVPRGSLHWLLHARPRRAGLDPASAADEGDGEGYSDTTPPYSGPYPELGPGEWAGGVPGAEHQGEGGWDGPGGSFGGYEAAPGVLTWAQRVRLAAGAARGINFLHNGALHPILHLDIKSANILVDAQFGAKVSDFGLSRVYQEHAQGGGGGPPSSAGSAAPDPSALAGGGAGGVVGHSGVSASGGVVNGTPGYVDPACQRSSQLSEKSDVYSFGVVLLELATGWRPLETLGEHQGPGSGLGTGLGQAWGQTHIVERVVRLVNARGMDCLRLEAFQDLAVGAPDHPNSPTNSTNKSITIRIDNSNITTDSTTVRYTAGPSSDSADANLRLDNDGTPTNRLPSGTPAGNPQSAHPLPLPPPMTFRASALSSPTPTPEGPPPLEAFARLVCLGAWCCLRAAHRRPAMRQVLRVLMELEERRGAPGEEQQVLHGGRFRERDFGLAPRDGPS